MIRPVTRSRSKPAIYCIITLVTAVCAQQAEQDAVLAAHGIHRSVTFAQQKLPSLHRADRLLIPLLASRAGELCCCLKRLADGIGNTTRLDIVIFSVQNHVEVGIREGCPHLGLENVLFMALNEHWVTPLMAGPAELWSLHPQFDEAYRRMGHWRLAFQIPFAAALGYKYVLQMDDDSYVGNMGIDLVQYLKNNHFELGARSMHKDQVATAWGLPELVKYYLVTDNIHPTTLWEHCSPPNLDGLFSQSLESFEGKEARSKYTGWDIEVLGGNFLLISTEFWMQERVQKFLRLVLGTGGHFRFRWNEQSVIAMLWQIFVRPENFTMLDIEYRHPAFGDPGHECGYLGGRMS